MFFINHTETVKDKIVIVEVSGPLNSETGSGFEAYIDQIISTKKSLIVIDASKLEFVSSAGIGAFIYSQKKIISGNGYMVICGLSEEISSLFRLLGFDKIFMMAGSRDEAFSIMDKQLELRSDGAVFKSSTQPQGGDIGFEIKSEYPETDETGPDGGRDGLEFSSPIILECAECKSVIRIKRAGSYICPDCKTDFTVDQDQTIIF